MKRLLVLLPVLFLTVACQKKPDAPVPATSPATPTNPADPGTTPTTPPPTPPPPVTSCQGATIPVSVTDTVNDNSSKDFTIAHFEQSCGDTVTVFFRTANYAPSPAPAWTQLNNTTDTSSTYYSINNQVITFHNKTGIVLEIDIEAVLK